MSLLFMRPQNGGVSGWGPSHLSVATSGERGRTGPGNPRRAAVKAAGRRDSGAVGKDEKQLLGGENGKQKACLAEG